MWLYFQFLGVAVTEVSQCHRGRFQMTFLLGKKCTLFQFSSIVFQPPTAPFQFFLFFLSFIKRFTCLFLLLWFFRLVCAVSYTTQYGEKLYFRKFFKFQVSCIWVPSFDGCAKLVAELGGSLRNVTGLRQIEGSHQSGYGCGLSWSSDLSFFRFPL